MIPINNSTGWWYTYPCWKIKSMEMMIPKIWKMFQTTSNFIIDHHLYTCLHHAMAISWDTYIKNPTAIGVVSTHLANNGHHLVGLKEEIVDMLVSTVIATGYLHVILKCAIESMHQPTFRIHLYSYEYTCIHIHIYIYMTTIDWMQIISMVGF